MSNRQFVKLTYDDTKGRYTVEARKTLDGEWFWVESILGVEFAEKFADKLENDDKKRAEYIDESN